MTTTLFTKLLLVNNIPKIAGIYEAQDLIKKYAYGGEFLLYKALDFSVRFFSVNQEITLAYSRYNIPDDECHWGFDNGLLINEIGLELRDMPDNLIVQLQAVNCPRCGEYRSISDWTYNIRIPCLCLIEP